MSVLWPGRPRPSPSALNPDKGVFYILRTSSERLNDADSRRLKALKIQTALSDALGGELTGLRCVDIGCATGLVTRHLAPSFAHTIGLEYDLEALRQASHWGDTRLSFGRADGRALPIPDEAVDVVVCAQVYEHIQPASELFAEIWRVLVPGGVCFFSGPNRLFPWEFHCRLPFVHWLPSPVARLLVRALRPQEEYDVHPLTLWGLRRLVRRFGIRDYTVAMMRRPAQYGCRDEMGPLVWLSRLPTPWLRAILPLVPNYNWVLTKPRG